MGPSQSNELIVDAEYGNELLRILRAANNEVLICAYAWRIYANEPERGIQRVITEVINARKRGVVVRCIIDKYTSVRPLTEYGIECRFIGQRNTMHTKAVCVDNYALLLGSHNLTARAFEMNREASILTTDYETISQFKTYFNTIWGALNESGTNS